MKLSPEVGVGVVGAASVEQIAPPPVGGMTTRATSRSPGTLAAVNAA
jgi:hypothetical protein